VQSIKSIVIKEWKCFVGSDRGLFFFYGILMVSWSMFLAFREQPDDLSAPWWLIFFSVVVTANFSNTVFISERINGALEILISSGHSRMAILYGKIFFILIMSIVMGLFCVTAGTFVRGFFVDKSASIAVMDIVVYIAAALFNTVVQLFYPYEWVIRGFFILPTWQCLQ
jgi:ABC-type transport system involved in multi-copper enzyme maturation permease subunit